MLVAVAVTAGCNKDDEVRSKAETAAGGPDPAKVDAEIQTLAAALDETLATNASRSCPRPVLRGEASRGRADEKIRALLDPDGPQGPCFAATIADGSDLVSACVSLAKAVTAAVQHGDACSPMMIGRGPVIDSLSSVVRIGKGLAAVSRARAEAGEPAAALRDLFDGVRLQQDLLRGGVSWLEVMVVHAASEALLDAADAVVAADSLPPEDIPALRKELATLVASEPDVGASLVAERVSQQQYELRGPVSPRGWAPVGGWRDGRPPPKRATGPGERWQMALAWRVVAQLAERERAACPSDASVHACVEGLDRLATDLTKGDTDWVQRWTASLAAGAEVEQAVVDTLLAIAAPGVVKYVRRAAIRRARLAALDVALRVAAGESCPEPKAITGDDVEGLGAPLQARRRGSSLHLSPPAFLELPGDTAVSRIGCGS